MELLNFVNYLQFLLTIFRFQFQILLRIIVFEDE